jgi:hypothetical protein
MQDLDLKFVCHYGEFIKQKMSGRDELAGRDVILVHRLLKNGVSQDRRPAALLQFGDFACPQDTVPSRGHVTRRLPDANLGFLTPCKA